MARRLRLALVLSACALVPPGHSPVVLAQGTGETGASPEPAPAATAPRANLGEANAAVRATDYARADELLAAVLQQFPDDPAALLMRGEVLLALAKPAEARPHLERAAALDPKRERVHFQLASVLQAEGEIEAAIDHFGHLLLLVRREQHGADDEAGDDRQPKREDQ